MFRWWSQLDDGGKKKTCWRPACFRHPAVPRAICPLHLSLDACWATSPEKVSGSQCSSTSASVGAPSPLKNFGFWVSLASFSTSTGAGTPDHPSHTVPKVSQGPPQWSRDLPLWLDESEAVPPRPTNLQSDNGVHPREVSLLASGLALDQLAVLAEAISHDVRTRRPLKHDEKHHVLRDARTCCGMFNEERVKLAWKWSS